MTRPIMHPCPGGCGTDVPHQRLACPSCWWLLPKPLRDNVTRNYRRDALEHARAVSEALRWYRANVEGGVLVR